MSLKAKIEAVIYACEEPVTLAQITGLLGQEAAQELEALAARQHTLHLAEPVDPAHADAGDTGDAGDRDASQTLEDDPGERAPGAENPHADPREGFAAAPGDAVGGASAQRPADSEDARLAAEDTASKRAGRDRDRRVREYLRETVDRLIAEYATSDRGLEIREVAGGYRMATKPEYHDAVRGFVKSLKPVLKLTLQALETLAVVAYKQPVTGPEISEIRGVDSGGVLGSLLARKLIATAGRKQVIGRPILYRTTKDFLLRFGLKDISELPSIEEFEKMAGELAEQEEIPMPPHGSDTAESEERITHENLEEEKHATEPQADGDSGPLEPDESNRADNELPAVDGRISGLPPSYDRPGDDPSADEAAIQSSEGEGS